MTTRPVIEVTDLHRRYGGPDGFEAVRGVGFTVGPGELFALLGTNGAGKTSTLDVLEGLAAPTSGTVRVHGLDPWRDRRELRPYTGIMLQSGGFPPDLTVAETVTMWAGTLSDPRPVDEALRLVDIDAKRDVLVKQLSGGEQRRLDLALTLLNRPTVVFLDEPTTGLDPESRRNTWELIRRIRDEGACVVLTTHYLDEAQTLADHLAIMDAGRVVMAGTVAEIVADHPARIAFAPPDRPLPTLPATVEVRRAGRMVEVATTDLQTTLTDLLLWARGEGVTLPDLTATPASLESVFLSITAGRRSQDASAADPAGAGEPPDAAPADAAGTTPSIAVAGAADATSPAAAAATSGGGPR